MAIDKPNDAVLQALAALLEGKGDKPLYAIIDAAANTELVERLYADESLEFECLLQGDIEPDVFYVAPFIINLTGKPELLRWLLTGWRRNWGLYITGRFDFETTYRHLRGYARACDTNGHMASVRYYDPRVFPILGVHLSATQLAEFFVGIESVTMESSSGQSALRFGFENQSLVRTELAVETRHVGT